MSEIQALAAHAPGGALHPFTYELGPLGPDAVEIAVINSGLCHSDLSMLDDAWGMTAYPFVPGHEVVGTVAAVGERVTGLELGQKVGLGWHAGYCRTCPQCLSGRHNVCPEAEMTIVGRHGGFADRVRAQATAVVPLPPELDAATAGPLLCAGITVFNALRQFDVKPTDRVAVVGIGGLGHLALQFMAAWGCAVTAFTSSAGKRAEALELGAHDTVDSRDPDALAAAAGRFDFVLSTVDVKLDWNAYLQTLRPHGRLHLVGVTSEPLDLSVVPMLFGQRSVSSSPVGPPAELATMLDFAARHGIAPVVERFAMADANAAFAHLRAGKARYRVVLDAAA
ncbi:MAG: NAD(P)-dependent alcohol dehydrogenase [Alphaproteobacteria bacterium]